MSEREKQILETIATAISKMSDFDKGELHEHVQELRMP